MLASKYDDIELDAIIRFFKDSSIVGSMKYEEWWESEAKKQLRNHLQTNVKEHAWFDLKEDGLWLHMKVGTQHLSINLTLGSLSYMARKLVCEYQRVHGTDNYNGNTNPQTGMNLVDDVDAALIEVDAYETCLSRPAKALAAEVEARIKEAGRGN